MPIVIVVDARARRKRRQLSSSSYYISSVNPYSSSYNPSAPLTYPSGSYYSAPGYGYPNTGYSGDVTYNSDYYSPDSSLSALYLSGSSQTYQYPNLGSTYGSGTYAQYASPLYAYGPPGFNNQYPNWNQGNGYQYYTGGTGAGLTNTGYVWYRSLGGGAFRGRAGDNFVGNSIGPNLPVGQNPPLGMNPLNKPNIPIGLNPSMGPNPSGPIGKSAPINSLPK